MEQLLDYLTKAKQLLGFIFDLVNGILSATGQEEIDFGGSEEIVTKIVDAIDTFAGQVDTLSE